jgi:YHS domain-containing protein
VRAVGGSADVIQQPGAHAGQQAYCPVSGVVFEVKAGSARREVNGKPVYFCCEGCANYFNEHREAVIAARGLPAR